METTFFNHSVVFLSYSNPLPALLVVCFFPIPFLMVPITSHQLVPSLTSPSLTTEIPAPKPGLARIRLSEERAAQRSVTDRPTARGGSRGRLPGDAGRGAGC